MNHLDARSQRNELVTHSLVNNPESWALA